MQIVKPLFDLRTLKFKVPAGVDGAFALAHMMAFRENALGVKLNSISGTAITGTLSGANLIFTSSSAIQWINTQTLTVGAITGTMTVGNAITQATSSAAGVILNIEEAGATNYITIGTITVAAFNATNIVTDSTDGGTATPTAVETALVDLAGFWAFAYIASTLNGNFVRVESNTAAAITTDAAMTATATKVILFPTEDAAIAAADFVSMAGPDDLAVCQLVTATTATIANGDTTPVRIVAIDAGTNAIVVTLPDIRLVDVNQQIFFIAVDATTNAFTFVSPIAAQTLDGVDISAAGTPFATINADGDFLGIQRDGLVWKTIQNGIS